MENKLELYLGNTSKVSDYKCWSLEEIKNDIIDTQKRQEIEQDIEEAQELAEYIWDVVSNENK